MLTNAGVARWADHFVAITDPDTELARRAAADGFRDTFINPADIGGRFLRPLVLRSRAGCPDGPGHRGARAMGD
ncbi:MAG: hypothetical protein QM736_13895 [Vicinamibacterales bacterium]